MYNENGQWKVDLFHESFIDAGRNLIIMSRKQVKNKILP